MTKTLDLDIKTKPGGDIIHIVQNLKGYLEYLRSCGIEEIPLQNLPDFSSEKRRGSSEPKQASRIQPQIKQEKPFESKKVESTEPDDLFLMSKSIARTGTLEDVREEIGDCKRCKLHSGRKNIVFGTGDPKAELVFIGEGPGEEEDLRGEPFVGKAGQLLTRIIEDGMKLKRKDVYICNVVKCRPPQNRDPEKEEIEACNPFLIKQLQAIKPRVIVALGRPAASTLLRRNVFITKERGTWHTFEGIKVMLTYHPSFILRRYTTEIRRQVYNDMLQVLEELKK